MTDRPSPWWHHSRHADRRPFLIARNRIAQSLRGFFEARGFLEADCGALQVSPGNEAHLHAFATELVRPDGGRVQRYLHTSPEFACKKLLAAGEPRIFSLVHVYRNREETRLHAAEFTMLEWYRSGEGYETVMRDAIDILRDAAFTAGKRQVTHREAWCDPFASPDFLTVGDAFRLHAGLDLFTTLNASGEPDRDAFARLAEASHVRSSGNDSWSDIFSRVMAERIEPELGRIKPLILYEYPVSEAALARVTAHDPRVAERFELYVCGVELVNGFGELTDAAEQRRRFIAEMDLKQARYGERYPVDEEFLDALGQMPEASGAAMGFDRLVMLVTGAATIEQVIWTPLS